MPEVRFEVRWPDAVTVEYYSPSTAVHAHLRAGEEYSLTEFVERSRAAMQQASERVRAKYGYTCSSALETLQWIEETSREFVDAPDARVSVVRMLQD